MTLADLLVPLNAAAKAGGVSFLDITDTVPYYALISRGLKQFSRFCFSKFDPEQSLTLTVNTREHSVSPMFLVKSLTVGGQLIRHPIDGSLRPISIHEIPSIYPTYQTDASGPVTGWVAMPGRMKIATYPKPSSAPSNTFVAGFCEHATVTATGDTLDLEDYVLDWVAAWCATLLEKPHLSGSGIYSLLKDKHEGIAKELMDYRRENLGEVSSRCRRGSGISMVQM